MVGSICVGLFVFGLATNWTLSAPPSPAPTAQPDPKWTPVPKVQSESTIPKPAIALPASAPTRLEAPTIGFDSYAFLGNGVPLIQWTQEEDDAYNKVVTPHPWQTAVVWDASNDHGCGGMPATERQPKPFCIFAHTSPASWGDPAPFNGLRKLRVGDPIAISTAKGTLCYTVSSTETVRKSQLDSTLKARLANGTYPDGWLTTCNRPDNWPDNAATVDNRVVGITLNQQGTNAGTCW